MKYKKSKVLLSKFFNELNQMIIDNMVSDQKIIKERPDHY